MFVYTCCTNISMKICTFETKLTIYCLIKAHMHYICK
uniref:Uncharacterized protein n=1 Tax=Anguilla anguilla TaxID=7936 RepID=A0A0E9XKF9_ANGAN